MSNEVDYEQIGDKDIAIVGMSGRFPKSKNLAAYWDNLKNGVECVTHFTDEELLALGVEPALLNDPNYIKAALLLDDIEMFDASFFGYTPKEAEIMDPQQRIFLELAWEALENAGYTPENYNGLIGVYSSIAWNTYLISNLCSNKELFEGGTAFQVFTTNDKDFMPTRVSYKLNLKGPSMNIQTACSSSLVATHLACLSLLNYECDMALTGGVTVKVPQETGYYYQEGSLASPDGHCRAFDANAHGTVFGSGAGIVVLKRATEAIEDGDHIYAIIKGTAINNDGSVKVSYTAPSVEGQAEVVAAAQSVSGIDPETITYIETHGTGTSLGDPIEVTALNKVFRENTDKKGYCAIGSVKTNVGHLDSAAGVAGLLKVAMSLENKLLPPSLNFSEPNPKIDFVNSPFFVNSTLREWKTDGFPRRAGVSSFGVGGTNAHAILEEAPELEQSSESREWQLLTLSAKTQSALDDATANLAEFLKNNPGVNLADAAYTLKTGRSVFRNRRVVVCNGVDDAINVLETQNPARVFSDTDTQEPRQRPVVFMLSGQGSQYVNMGLELYETELVFRDEIDNCASILQPILGFDLRSVIYPDGTETESAAEKLNQTHVTQPALFVIEYALAKLLMSWGIDPRAMIGHSIGEYVAACLAGVFTLEEALWLVANRGKLIQGLPAGAMLVVPMPEEDVKQYLSSEISLAAVNGPSLCVVSGSFEAIDNLERTLTDKGIQCRRLHTSHAFHSWMMDEALDAFRKCLQKVKFQEPEMPYISNVTGTWIRPEEATDAEYWLKHLRGTVCFAQGMEELLHEAETIFLEVGPGRTLATLASRQTGRTDKHVILNSTRHPGDNNSDAAFMLATLGRLWLAGLQIDWAGYYEGEVRRRTPLPTYPFERQRYWIEPKKLTAVDAEEKLSVEKISDISKWFYTPMWKRSALPKAYKQEGMDAAGANWLVFADAYGLGDEIAASLKQSGKNVTVAKRGTGFNQDGEDTYTINPNYGEDYYELLQALKRGGKSPERIVHLWSLSDTDRITGTDNFGETQKAGFNSLLSLTQALDKVGMIGQVKVSVVANAIASITYQEALDPAKTMLLGQCKVMAQEYPELSTQCIDIVLADLTANKSGLAKRLLSEIVSEASDDIVAYRGNQRWAKYYESIALDADKANDKFKENGVYLITGGLDGAGLALADHLAKSYKAKLALIDATADGTPFPAKENWDAYLAGNAEDATAAKIKRVQAMEQCGAEVLVISADVADKAQMLHVVELAEERFGAIKGVIHGAEVPNEKIFNLIQGTDAKQCDLQFKPKVYGLYVLDEIFKDRELDFAVACSSLAAVLGGLGYAAYAAANIFADSFAANSVKYNATPWISINLDAWNFAEEKGQVTDYSSSLAQFAMKLGEGIEVVERIINDATCEQVIVSTANLQARMKQLARKAKGAGSQNSSEEKASVSNLYPRPKLQNPYVESENETQKRIADIWARVFGFEQVGIHDNFFDLGGDSLIAVQVVNQLKKEFEREIQAVSLFQALTVKAMSELLGQDEAAAAEERAAEFEEQKEKMNRRKQFQQKKRLTKKERDDADNE